MAVVKVSVSLDESVLEETRAFVGARELSTYVNEALAAQNRRRAGLKFLAELDREYGSLSPDDPAVKSADKEWKAYVSSSIQAHSRRSRKAIQKRAGSSKKR